MNLLTLGGSVRRCRPPSPSPRWAAGGRAGRTSSFVPRSLPCRKWNREIRFVRRGKGKRECVITKRAPRQEAGREGGRNCHPEKWRNADYFPFLCCFCSFPLCFQWCFVRSLTAKSTSLFGMSLFLSSLWPWQFSRAIKQKLSTKKPDFFHSCSSSSCGKDKEYARSQPFFPTNSRWLHIFPLRPKRKTPRKFVNVVREESRHREKKGGSQVTARARERERRRYSM